MHCMRGDGGFMKGRVPCPHACMRAPAKHSSSHGPHPHQSAHSLCVRPDQGHGGEWQGSGPRQETRRRTTGRGRRSGGGWRRMGRGGLLRG